MFEITANRLGKYYGNRWIFRKIDFGYSGKVLGVAGPNGSGKTTLMRCLSGLIKPNEGQLSWKKNGVEIAPDGLRKEIGYAAPYINLYHELTIHENLMFIARVRGLFQTIGHEGVLARMIESVNNAGISQLLHQNYGSLSSGQQQRARLVSATFYNPGILFLDEPGTNLDVSGDGIVKELVESHEGIVILASNDPGELKLCDKQILLKN